MMQIKQIVLYGYNGRVRSLSFSLGKVNIIPGDSKTGKSTIADIITYCTGSTDCPIAEGVVRQCVEWFGVMFELDNSENIFVARRNPGIHATTEDCYVDCGISLEIPPKDKIKANYTLAPLVSLLSAKIGIGDNQAILSPQASRQAIKANIKHAMAYCIQGQSDIASKTTLFRKQSETFVAVAIKDTFPFFIGAVDYDDFLLSQKCRDLEERLRKEESKKRRAESVLQESLDDGLAIIQEAETEGMMPNEEDFDRGNANAIKKAIEAIAGWSPQNEDHCTPSKLSELQNRYMALRGEIRSLDLKIESISGFNSVADRWSKSASLQKERLESIHLFDELTFKEGVCPFCGGGLEMPGSAVQNMKQSLMNLDEELTAMSAGVTKAKSILASLAEDREGKKRQLSAIKRDIDNVYEQNRRIEANRNDLSRKSQISGKAAYWLHLYSQNQNIKSLEEKIASLREEIDKLTQKVGEEARKERVGSALSVIQMYMSEYATELQAEHANEPFRLNMNKLTVQVDMPTRSVTFSELGSGSNWLKCHILTFFALQRLFVERNSPVPNFLFLDQPSQVFFPNEASNMQSTDMQEVKQIYQFMKTKTSQLDGKLQVIIVDHADLQEEWFQDSVVEKWQTGGLKLVPEEWLSAE